VVVGVVGVGLFVRVGSSGGGGSIQVVVGSDERVTGSTSNVVCTTIDGIGRHRSPATWKPRLPRFGTAARKSATLPTCRVSPRTRSPNSTAHGPPQVGRFAAWYWMRSPGCPRGGVRVSTGPAGSSLHVASVSGSLDAPPPVWTASRRTTDPTNIVVVNQGVCRNGLTSHPQLCGFAAARTALTRVRWGDRAVSTSSRAEHPISWTLSARCGGYPQTRTFRPGTGATRR